MHGGDDQRVPRLAPGCDPTRLELTPAEGFLLSRIDGHTSCAMLRQLGGLPPAEVGRCLARWAKEGVVVFDGDRPAAPPRAAAAEPPPAAGSQGEAAGPPETAPGAEVEAALDPLLELDLGTQRAILAFEGRLDRPYHEILGVAADADPRAIKRAYFALSKEFHPDRYFRREIGSFKARLDRVFRKIVEAYELLSDPATRAEVQRNLAPEPAAPSAAGGGAAKGPAARQRPLNPFSPIARMLARRKAKAKSFFEAGMTAFAEGRWLEAAGSVRLAIAYDPGNALYRERFGDVQRKANDFRFEQVMKEADAAMTFRDRADALKLYEEALHYRPFDAGTNHTAARLAWLVAGDLRKAKEYAVTACEAEPDHPDYRRVLGQIYKAAGLTANARRELQKAVRLNPKDAEARAELKSL